MSELFNKINWVDVLALILLLRISYISSRIGVGKQILPLALLVLILVISLGNYDKIAWVFVDRYGFSKSLCLFSSYAFMLMTFFVVYHIVSRLTTALPEAAPLASMERFFGVAIGIIRATIVIGLVCIGFLLAPVKFIADAAKNSYSAQFFINTYLKAFSLINNSFNKEKISPEQALGTLSMPKDYMLKIGDSENGVKTNARFYKEKY